MPFFDFMTVTYEPLWTFF